MIALMTVAIAAAGVLTNSNREDLDAVYAPQRVALLIGVQDYSDPQLQGLQYAVKDAQDMGNALQDPNLGAFDRVVVVAGQNATTAGAIKQIIEQATADLQRDDTFLLYASGHGTLVIDPLQGSRLFFLPSDGEIDHPEETGISVSWLEETISALPARQRVLIMDTCHNGRSGSRSAINTATASLIDGFRGEAPPPRSPREVSESEARLYAAEFHQPAMEDPSLQNGVYTHFLLEALTTQHDNADLDRDGLIDVVEAHDYAMDHTWQHTGGVQVPRAEYRITGKERIYLSGDPSARGDAERALLSAYDQVLSRARLLVDGIPRGTATGVHPIEPGRHEIEILAANGQTITRQNIRVDAGTVLSLESLFETQGSRWFATAGSSIRHGQGVAAYHPITADLTLGWMRSMSTQPWLHPAAHLRLNWMTGKLNPEDPIIDTGEVALGAGLGMAPMPWLLVGPQAEITTPFRWYADENGQHRQSGFGPSVGAWTQVFFPIGNGQLTLRYDFRYNTHIYDADRTELWQNGIALGLSSQP